MSCFVEDRVLTLLLSVGCPVTLNEIATTLRVSESQVFSALSFLCSIGVIQKSPEEQPVHPGYSYHMDIWEVCL